jgi:hypothetical protein
MAGSPPLSSHLKVEIQGPGLTIVLHPQQLPTMRTHVKY